MECITVEKIVEVWNKTPNIQDASIEEKGLFSSIVHLCLEGRNCTMQEILEDNRNGKGKIRSTLRKLERMGCITRHKKRNSKGQIMPDEYSVPSLCAVRREDIQERYVMEEKESIQSADQIKTDVNVTQATAIQAAENPVMENPVMENPVMENPAMGNPVMGKVSVDSPAMDEPVPEARAKKGMNLKDLNEVAVCTEKIVENHLPKTQLWETQQWESQPLGNAFNHRSDIDKDLDINKYIYLIQSNHTFPDYAIPRKGNTSIGNKRSRGFLCPADMDQCRAAVKEQIEYDILVMDGYEQDMLDEIVDLMAEIFCSNRKRLCVAKEERPVEVVHSRFRKLKMTHIQYVFECLGRTATKVRNIRQYLLTVLFNAPATIGHYYAAEVRHDAVWGKPRLCGA